jgi:ribosomal protein L11 methyltransferase
LANEGARPPGGGERRAAPIGGDQTTFAALRFDAVADAADGWADMLQDAGALCVDIADAHAETPDESPLYDEPDASGAARWPVSRLTALFSSAPERSAALAGIATRGGPLPPHETFDVPERDWVRATQAQFTPLRIADALWIVPSWCEAVDPSAVNLALDPGLAFGTGSHPTTRLCLRWLAHELRSGESVLDYGCGSGILAIAACRLGAGRVVGTDIDSSALEASRRNASQNGIDATFVPVDGLRAIEGPFDIVVANILANPLISLASELARHTRHGGRIVLSGVLDEQSSAVIDMYARWFNIGVGERDEGWCSLVGIRAAIAD